MTFLELIQKFTTRTGIPKPTFVIGNTDPQVMQLQGLLEECLEELAQRTNWTGLNREATFTTVAAVSQGAITTLADEGFKWILNDTLYDRTQDLPFFGPVSPERWQALQALPTTGPFYKYRISEGLLLIDPIPAAGHSAAFEYSSDYAVVNAAGDTYKAAPTVDTDTFVLPDTLLLAGLRWKWKAEKGLDYAEDFNRYEELVNNAIGRDGTKPKLSMNEQSFDVQPGIFVPSGNWNVP